jgi:hypothetical protein
MLVPKAAVNKPPCDSIWFCPNEGQCPRRVSIDRYGGSMAKAKKTCPMQFNSFALYRGLKDQIERGTSLSNPLLGILVGRTGATEPHAINSSESYAWLNLIPAQCR